MIRRKTRAVRVGDVIIGGDNPIVIQSMCNTKTTDTEATVGQIIRIYKAGGQIVRNTVINTKEARNLEYIKEELKKRGYNIPLVADIHFNPEAAFIAAKYYDKVRINPGNFIDRRAVFKTVEYTDSEYSEEIKKIEEKLVKLIDICKKHNTAIRIGTNHGSLSDRIMSKYGNTPLGMVKATMEFLRVCKKVDFNNVIISMKSSNTFVMVAAVRMLIETMDKENIDFPLHLGVTEAGEGEDGIIKSSVGLGALLGCGIGDTIRVSLTDEPENEIPIAKSIVYHFSSKNRSSESLTFNLKDRSDIGKALVISQFNTIEESINSTSDFCIIKNKSFNFKEGSKYINLRDFKEKSIFAENDFIKINSNDINSNSVKLISKFTNPVVLEITDKDKLASVKECLMKCSEFKNPLLLMLTYDEKNLLDFQIKAACDLGEIVIGKAINGVLLSNSIHFENFEEEKLAYNILQSGGLRITKTEYISCPGCGRTQYNLQETTKKIKKALGYNSKLKIAVMGCVINGPGEMADADYGYVGSGKNKVSLYKKQVCIRRNINEDEAVEILLEEIKKDFH